MLTKEEVEKECTEYERKCQQWSKRTKLICDKYRNDPEAIHINVDLVGPPFRWSFQLKKKLPALLKPHGINTFDKKEWNHKWGYMYYYDEKIKALANMLREIAFQHVNGKKIIIFITYNAPISDISDLIEIKKLEREENE